MSTMTLFGLRLNVPSDWADHSLFRFTIPRPAPESPHLAVRKKPTAQFSSNVVVSRHAVAAEIAASDFLAATRERRQPRDAALLESGSCVMGDAAGAYEDYAFFAPQAQLKIFQRCAAFRSGDFMIVVTITSDRSDLAAVASSLGIR